ncbi:hypothetical protein EYF80_061997 [Liparis tanakae]|uniref:Uncharacterized protein n=1 Tax=Liparis tanakae TaxID=230148 RepID=A0A4Z2EG50_9TELE|nr:hypothetical protein EYF80_061997 [Liparis tanakae]
MPLNHFCLGDGHKRWEGAEVTGAPGYLSGAQMHSGAQTHASKITCKRGSLQAAMFPQNSHIIFMKWLYNDGGGHVSLGFERPGLSLFKLGR